MSLSKYAIALTLAVISTPIAGTAFAEGLTASLSKSTGLSRAGEEVTLNIAGVPSGQGVYILQCETPAVAGERPTVCVGQSKTIWASTISTPGAQPLSPEINLSLERHILAGGNTIDCSVSSCGVFIRRDHNGPADKTLDIFLSIAFTPEYSVQVSKTATISYAGENLKVKILGLTNTQGVYVRLCQAATAGERPSVCYGLGVWASLSQIQQGFGAVNAEGELTLPVKSSFVSGGNNVDCSKTSCVVFVRADHTGGPDLSLDRVIPLTFTAPPAPAISARAGKSGTSFVFVIKNAKAKSIKVIVGPSVKIVRPTSDSYTVKISVGKNKGKNTTLKVTYGNKVLTKTTLKG